MIKLEIDIRDIDYDSLLEQYLPALTEQLRRSGNPVAMLLSNGMPASMARMVLKKLPPATKEQLTADLINSNREQLEKLLKDMAGSQKIRLEIAGLKAETKNG